MKTSHPRIWSFITTLNEIIQDVDNEIARLCHGREITRETERKKDIRNYEIRCLSKQKLSEGAYTPWEYFLVQ